MSEWKPAQKPDVIRAEYLISAVRQEQYPPGDEPEIAFIGRSNVGKSSLINSVCRHRGLALTSGTPGKTQTINFFRVVFKLPDNNSEAEVRRQAFFVDLPGYGYAKTGRNARRQWAKFVEEYFLQSPRLKRIYQLIDIRHPPMESDIVFHAWLKQQGLPVKIVATKSDKITRSRLKEHLGVIARALEVAPEQILTHSALSGAGRDALLDDIVQIFLDIDRGSIC